MGNRFFACPIVHVCVRKAVSLQFLLLHAKEEFILFYLDYSNNKRAVHLPVA